MGTPSKRGKFTQDNVATMPHKSIDKVVYAFMDYDYRPIYKRTSLLTLLLHDNWNVAKAVGQLRIELR